MMLELADGALAGRTSAVYGGGPSLRGHDFFSERVKEKYACIIGCNLSHPEPDVTLAIDHRILDAPETREKWLALNGIHVYLNRTGVLPVNMPPQVRVLPALDSRWSTTLRDGLLLANNAGLASLNLATILGAASVSLYGFDLSGESGRTANWHEHYPDRWRSNEIAYATMLASFRRWAAVIRSKMTIRVMGPSPLRQLLEG
jgi:hypothetical protein